MRSHVEFRSDKFPSYGNNDEGLNFENAVYGKRLAEYLGEKLDLKEMTVSSIYAEDWGWCLEISHTENYRLFIGCGHYQEYENGFLCFIEPSKPYIRKWFKKINVRETVEKVASALDAVLNKDRDIHSVRWWDEGER